MKFIYLKHDSLNLNYNYKMGNLTSIIVYNIFDHHNKRNI